MKFIKDTARGFYPFLVCLLGAALIASSFDFEGWGKLLPALFGCCAFAWAIDMAETRARAAAREEWAAKVLGSFLTGSDTEIRVVISDDRQAAE